MNPEPPAKVTRYVPGVRLRGHVRGGQAKVAELVDALDLGSSGATRESSSLSFRTILIVGMHTFFHCAGTARFPESQISREAI